MKSEDMSSSETRGKPYQRRVLLCDSSHPIVPHPPSSLSRMSHLPLALTSKGGSIMQEALLSSLATWHNFYSIIGTAAATLTGLLFVVITLSAGGEAVVEGWGWDWVLPGGCYTGLVGAALLLPIHPEPALFVIGAGTVLLLFIGIHNAWDNVTYIVIELSQPENKRQDQ